MTQTKQNTSAPDSCIWCGDYPISLDRPSLYHLFPLFPDNLTVTDVGRGHRRSLLQFRGDCLRFCPVRAQKPPRMETAQTPYNLFCNLLVLFSSTVPLEKPKAAACRMHRNGNRAAVEEFKGRSNHTYNSQKFIYGNMQGFVEND